MAEQFLDGRVVLHCGDCREVLAAMAENSFDACVTDPPYHLTAIAKRFGHEWRYGTWLDKPDRPGIGGAMARLSRGFMGQRWDGGDIAFDPTTWRVVLRVLKPGAHAVVFTIPRHVGLVQVAMQEAGFEFRDMLVWAFGSGFPKSHDVSKGIDRALDFERAVIGTRKDVGNNSTTARGTFGTEITMTETTNLFGHAWEGWGTALKPAVELIILARKPLSEGTVAANVLKWGTGAINVDGCRVGTEGGMGKVVGQSDEYQNKEGGWGTKKFEVDDTVRGRWPANLVLTLPEDEYELRPFVTSEQKRELFRWLSENA